MELTQSVKGNLRMQIHTKLSRAVDAYTVYLKLEKDNRYTPSNKSLSKIFILTFVKRQEDALNIFLEYFQRILSLYTAMNPNEKVEDIRLLQ
jgi:hypothetical protein